MLFAEAVYVGIDPTAGVRPMHYAVLDGDLRVAALNQGDMETVLAFVGGLEAAVVAIDAPQSPNQGRMLQREVRRRYNLEPGGKSWGQWKECEYELRRRNIRLYNTPSNEKDAARWVRTGFSLYRRLAGMRFRFFVRGEETGPRTMLEVHPHGCFAVLLGHRPFLKQTLEGRLQRQLVLYQQGVDIPDPLKVLEEITRHHVLSGQLPLEGLYSHDELDALAAAFTAYLVGTKTERVSQVGDREEGLITLPAPELRDFYA
jgi:predicted nuclease with RNAse H fold